MGRRRRKNKQNAKNEDVTTMMNSGVHMHDLDVPIPQVMSKPSIPRLRALVERLSSTGYSVVALSHTVHGRVTEKDDANIAIPIYKSASTTSAAVDNSAQPKKRKLRDDDNEGHTNNDNDDVRSTLTNKLTILRRLNVIIEQVSDLAHYTINPSSDNNSYNGESSNKTVQQVMNSYDLIAISPRNDATFTAICNTINAADAGRQSSKRQRRQSLLQADILTLDYTAGRGGVQLPFKLRSSDLRSAISGRSSSAGITLELTYAPALYDVTKRKAFVMAARQLVVGCAGIGVVNDDGDREDGGDDEDTSIIVNHKNRNGRLSRNFPRIILSSGNRMTNSNGAGIASSTASRVIGDAGGMALRTPGDLINLMQVILGFDANTARGALSICPWETVWRARERRKRMTMMMSSLPFSTDGNDSISRRKKGNGIPPMSVDVFQIGGNDQNDGDNIEESLVELRDRCLNGTSTTSITSASMMKKVPLLGHMETLLQTKEENHSTQKELNKSNSKIKAPPESKCGTNTSANTNSNVKEGEQLGKGSDIGNDDDDNDEIEDGFLMFSS